MGDNWGDNLRTICGQFADNLGLFNIAKHINVFRQSSAYSFRAKIAVTRMCIGFGVIVAVQNITRKALFLSDKAIFYIHLGVTISLKEDFFLRVRGTVV